jgi:DNA-binding CsgD family transcriptional regulator
MYTIEGRNYLDTNEAARRLGLHPNTLANHRAQERGMAYVKIRNLVLYREEDVAARFAGVSK